MAAVLKSSVVRAGLIISASRVAGSVRRPGSVACITLVALASSLFGEYRKEAPIAVVIAATGASFVPAGTRTPLAAQPGVFLFRGDTLTVSTGNMRILWCPDGAPQKFEYTIESNVKVTIDGDPPSLPNRRQLDLCLLPDLERAPEVTTLPSLSEILPPPLPANKVIQDIADTPPDTAAKLQAIGSEDMTDPRVRLSYAVSLASAGLYDAAIDQYAELARLWPDQPRLGRLILDLRQTGSTREIVHSQPGRPAPPAATTGKMYALVIGVKKYEQDRVPDLLFADADARDFAKFIASERGGKAEVTTLLNEQARSSEIRNRITDLLAKLHKDDTLVLFIAAHGDMRDDMPYVVTYRANPQDTAINGFPLSEIQKLRYGEKRTWRQVRVFLDICHGGNIALLDAAATKGGARTTHAPPSEFLCLTATHQGPDALAYEDPKFGHGVFTYFLLRGLATGEARDAPDDKFITAGGLSRYIETWVQRATTSDRDGKPRQKPTSILGVNLGQQLADLNLPGSEFNDTRPLSSLVIPADRLGKLRRQVPVRKQSSSLRSEAERPPNLERRVALEDEGEDILLRYLQGDEIPQDRAAFVRGSMVFAEALRLQPGSPYLEARAVFCEGRVAVFDRRYDDAIPKLERSIRLDPTAAYAYNALGIAYLEKGDFDLARLAFEDAIERAPKWAYSRHNLALAHSQAGNYELAVAAYRAAQERAPDYFYLPYNLGLLFQRMNRFDDAEAEYKIAVQNANRVPPGRSEPLIALGLLKATQRKWSDAERYYRHALDIPAAELTRRTARHNLALLLARKSATWPEAERLWNENGAYVPSRLALAQAYSAKGRTAEAIAKYRDVLSELPDHLSARIELATELEKSGDREAAASELREALSQQPRNALLVKRLAATLSSSGRRTEALALLSSEVEPDADRRTRSRARSASTHSESTK